ncbi:MAG: dehydrogenase [Parapedobacter sp.]|nr:MAG: dehydrogenase [Parapedobacter sp.]
MRLLSKFAAFYRLLSIPMLLWTACSVDWDDAKVYGEHDPERELESFQVADGYEVTLFAAEPLVVKPIQMNWDAKGRLWVISSTAYPLSQNGEEPNDKVFVLEDTNGDGVADKSTVFADGLNQPTGILPGDGGVYVANATEIIHLSDTNGDGKADVRKRILSGFGTADSHHLIHTFRWGPEGRLYFNQSIYIHSHVETPWGIRRLEGGGVWKLHPRTLELEVYSKGLVNPWGLRFNQYGQSFLTDGAGEEGINYAFPGATFLASPGGERILRGLNPGQPKHSGLEIISGRHLPDSLTGNLITNDFRANRVNRFQLEEQGSGYVSKQMSDLLWTDHVAFRPVDISVGPDGAIYIADWYNPIIQHGEVDFHDPQRDRERGRIWRVTAKNRRLVKKPKLTDASVTDLLEVLEVPEEWTRAQARQLLKERGAQAVAEPLQQWIDGLDERSEDHERLKLEGLWVSQAIDIYNGPLLGSLLLAEDHGVRSGALRALQLWHNEVDSLDAILRKAARDPHPQVRLEAAILLRSANTAAAAKTALDVLGQPMDEFLDFALWQTIRQLEPLWLDSLKNNPEFFGNSTKTSYALKSAASSDAISILTQLYKKGEVPKQYQQDALSAIAGRGQLMDMNDILDFAVDGFAKYKRDVSAELNAVAEASLNRKVSANRSLDRLRMIINSTEESSAIAAMNVAGALRVKSLQVPLKRLVDHENRGYAKAAMEALAAISPSEAQILLKGLTREQHQLDLRLLAVSQLASLNAPEAARIGVRLLNTLDRSELAQELFTVFFSDSTRTHALAEKLIATRIPEAVALAARRQLQSAIPGHRREANEVKRLIQGLEASGGVLPVERMSLDLKPEQIDSIASEVKKSGNPAQGELIFRKAELACLTCHAIGGAGGLIGPDLSSLGTSSPAKTIIKSIIFPTESIKEGYEMQRVARKDGREIIGYLVADKPGEIIMRDFTGSEIPVPKDNIKIIEKVPGSLMPPGLTASLNKQEFIDLISYLSKLGTTGDFRVSTERFVRRWEAVPSNDDLLERIKERGIRIIPEDSKISGTSHYSTVSGVLPIIELPVIKIGEKKYSVVKFPVEVLTPGEVTFRLNDANGIKGWADANAATIDNNELTASLAPGTRHITLVIDRNIREAGPLLVSLEDGSAQTRLVMGK